MYSRTAAHSVVVSDVASKESLNRPEFLTIPHPDNATHNSKLIMISTTTNLVDERVMPRSGGRVVIPRSVRGLYLP
jgi:hypothetical protein